MKILVVNPGSTSTKIGLFEDSTELWTETIRHEPDELKRFATVWEQYPYRKKIIMEILEKKGVLKEKIAAVAGRGGLFRPLKGGTYLVNEKMLKDAEAAERGSHASNIGAVIAWEIAQEFSVKSYIIDPVCVDELEDLARFSGIPELPRTSIFHALNVRAVARKYAEQLGADFQTLNLIVAHMGGGITVTALKKGRAVQISHGLYEGAFTPERCGNMPNLPLVEYADKTPREEFKKLISGKGGLYAYLGTSNALEIEKEIENGNEYFKTVYEAMAYQISEQIGARAAVLCGRVDAIILTGGLAYSKDYLNKWIAERCSFIAPIACMPGENEMEALAEGAFRVLSGKETAGEY